MRGGLPLEFPPVGSLPGRMCDLRFVRGGLLLEFPPVGSLPVECHNCNLGGGLPLEFPPVAAFCERGTAPLILFL